MVGLVLLGLRAALAGGREGLARLSLIAGGVGVGVALLLSLTMVPAFQGRADRAAWQQTSGRSPATAPDPALWLAVTDHCAGTPLLRVYVAPLGPRPPVPPGLDHLPGPGQPAVSPALARLMASTPDGQLDDRFPGRVATMIGADGLAWPDQLVAVVGVTERELSLAGRAEPVRGIERASALAPTGRVRSMLTIGAVALLTPVVVIFTTLVARIAPRAGRSGWRRSAWSGRRGCRPPPWPPPRPGWPPRPAPSSGG